MNEKIKCLGKEFNSEDERREYFRTELRKKLPELKKIEGFPIGEDEDILNLSDPPYYTACPNPWLNEFIAEWEVEKKLLEKDGKRSSDYEMNEPFADDVDAKKNHPIYNAHSYHTKVPFEIVMQYLLHYTQPGDVVLDPFIGSGMTGIAGNLCANPDQELKYQLESLNSFHKLNWGQRHIIGGDLAPFSMHIASNLNFNKVSKEFEQCAMDLLKELKNELGWIYEYKKDGFRSEIIYSVLTEFIECDDCGQNFPYWDSAVDTDTFQVKSEYPCMNCGNITNNTKGKKYLETVYDGFIKEVRKKRKYEHRLLSMITNGKRREIIVKNDDFIDKNKIDGLYQQIKLEKSLFLGKGTGWGDLWRKGIHEDIEYFHDLYSKENLIILSRLYSLINASNVSFETKKLLYFWFTASQSRLHIMNRYAPQHKRHVGPMANTYYISPLPAQISPFYFLETKLKDILKLKRNSSKENVLSTNSATCIPVKDESIDYIFTDPPFGGNIMYSELNYLYEFWLKCYTNSDTEAIVSQYYNKGLFEYQVLMERSFNECYRVLKKGKIMTVEFSNTSAGVWNAIQYSLQKSGFVISNVAGLSKGRGGMRAIIGPKAVNQDLVITCYKPSSAFDANFKINHGNEKGIWVFVDEQLNHLPIHLTKEDATSAIIERSPKILFDRLIAFYVQKGLPVPIDAGKFQQGLREQYIERDGMFFTNEQVQEYDLKKKENPEFIQLSILVSSEHDGVLWLKNLLSDKSLAYQDIQPLWMQALAGVRKGDIIPELADILEENFLKDSNGKWYVANPENESDLEKLRNKRLLKQFDTYKEEASKPKVKIKEARVEALRVGFKQCYQEKDFKTIVQIGDRIPNNLLMEDEVLLQFYDIAISRV
jgi:DNA modification methylase